MLSRIGNYHLVKPLGSGGMAQTFVAIRKGPAGFEQKVCLKRILPDRTCDRDFVEQFMDEARLLAQLRCAGIVQVYDFGEVVGVYYMALELVEGCDLSTLLRHLHGRKRRLPLLVTMHIVAKLLAALSYAHAAELNGEPLSLVHRDVSPSNILLSRNGEVKLADFGIAKFAQRSHKTRTGYIKGKALYMSPEQIRAEQLDGRSDLFAVGVLLYEALTGAHPFEAVTDTTVLTNILTGRRRPIKSLVPDIPDDVASLVDSLLALRREDRPASAAEALALIPSGAQLFVQERELAQLVTACANERAWVERRPNGAATQPLPRSDDDRTPRKSASDDRADRERVRTLQRTGTVDYHGDEERVDVVAPKRSGRSSQLLATLVFASSTLAILAWFALGSRHAPPPALPSVTAIGAPRRGSAVQSSGAVSPRARPDSPVSALDANTGQAPPHDLAHSDWSVPPDNARRSTGPTRPQSAVTTTRGARSVPKAPVVRPSRHRGSDITEDEF